MTQRQIGQFVSHLSQRRLRDEMFYNPEYGVEMIAIDYKVDMLIGRITNTLYR